MAGFESERKPSLLDAASLVNLIARAGPGASLSVRIHRKDGTSVLGRAVWGDDHIGSGPVVIFPNPENGGKDSFIPLGGQVVFGSPPRISSLVSARTIAVPLGKVEAHQSPINPGAQKYSFELVQNKK